MVEFKILRSTYDLEKDPKIYYLLLFNVRGNFFNGPLGYISLYREAVEEDDEKSSKKFLKKYEEYTKTVKARFTLFMDDLFEILEEEQVKGELLTLIKLLRSKANFDWNDMVKFEKFDREFERIINNIKKL